MKAFYLLTSNPKHASDPNARHDPEVPPKNGKLGGIRDTERGDHRAVQHDGHGDKLEHLDRGL